MRRLRPDNRRWSLVVLVDIAHHRVLQVGHAAKDTASSLLFGQIPEKALHHVQSGSARWSEMNMESLVVFRPALYLGMFVRGTIVAADVNFLIRRRVFVDKPKKFEPPSMVMALSALTEHLSRECVQCRK